MRAASKGPKAIKVLLRKRPHGTSWKVVTNARVAGKKVKQIHLGYVRKELVEFPEERRQHIEAALKARWAELFGNSRVAIDWVDANAKLRAKRSAFEQEQRARELKREVAEWRRTVRRSPLRMHLNERALL